MERSIWRILIAVCVVVLLSVVLLKGGYAVVAEQPLSINPQTTAATGLDVPGSPNTSSQGTEAQWMPASGVPKDLQPPFAAEQPPATNPQAPVAAEPAVPGSPNTSSQGTEAQVMPASGEAADDPALLAPTADNDRFYHIPGSVLMPVDSGTTLAYDYMGCVHANTGGSALLNAPLDIPEGSTLIGFRLYYYDTHASSNVQAWITRYNEDGTGYDDIAYATSSGTGGRGSVWADANSSMNVLDTYNWSYVLNVRLNAASSTLQVCGLRVMYTPPPGCCTYLPTVMRIASP